MKRQIRTMIRIGTAILALGLANGTFAQGTASTNNAVRFQTQLSQEFTNVAWDAGWASFQVEGE